MRWLQALPQRWLLGVLVMCGDMLVQAREPAGKEEAVKPAWQRMLQGEDAEQVQRREERLGQLQHAGKLAEALAVAKEVAELRSRLQGNDHWQTADARWHADYLRRILEQPTAVQKEIVQSAGWVRQAGPLQNQGRVREAQALFEKALALHRKVLGEEHPYTIYSYNNVAQNQAAQGRSAQAEEIYRKVLILFRKILREEHPQTGTCYNNRAANQLRQGKYKEAEEGYKKALAIFRTVFGPGHPQTAQTQYNLARSQQAQARYREAEDNCQQALAVFRKVFGDEHPQSVRCYRDLAAIQYERGKYADAEVSQRKVLAVFRKALGEENINTGRAYNELANTLQEQGKYRAAEEDYRKALDIFRKARGEEHIDTGAAYNNLALNQKEQGKVRAAEEGLRKALDITRKAHGEEHPSTAVAYYNLAGNQKAQGKYREAEQGYRKALDILRKVRGEEHPQTAKAYDSLATNLLAQGKYAEAEEGSRKALAICRKVLGEEHPETASCYLSLADHQGAQGKYAQAEEGCRKALTIYRKALGDEHTRTTAACNSLAYQQQAQGKYPQAEETLRQVLAIRRKVLGEEHPETAESYHNLAFVQKAQGKHEEAEEGFRMALILFRQLFGDEHPGTAQIYLNLAKDQQTQGRYRQAEEGFRKALAHYRKIFGDEHPQTVQGYTLLASNQHAQGKYAQAEALGVCAAHAFARVRHHVAASGLERAAFSSQHSPLPALAAVLARNNKPEEAWQRFEESLSRGAWDDLATQLRRPQAERDRQWQLAGHVEWLQSRIEHISRARSTSEQVELREELLGRLRQAYDEQAAFTHQLEKKYGPSAGQVFERRQIQKALPADTALLAWLDLSGQPTAADPNGEHWAVLLRSSGGPIWVRLQGSGDKGAWTSADDRLPGRLRAALQDSHSDCKSLAQRLRQQRLQPLTQHLEGVRHLLVLPSTALAGVPVEVIAEGYTVSYAHSGTLYAYLQQKQPADGKGLLALADPVFAPADVQDSWRGTDWQRLPGTRLEVAALPRLFGKQEPRHLLLDSQAGEQQLDELAQTGQLGRYRYLHLATHGEVDNVFPLRSALILAGDHLPDEQQRLQLLQSGQPIPDGRLSAEEVLQQWHLDSELVTLSACQTALGKYERGEGFVGFAQALILAGSRSVCLSLWKVDDTATALLMERFYQNLLGKREELKQPLGKAEALAEAKAWLRQLSREEAMKCAAQLSAGVERGKGRKAQPLLLEAAGKTATDRPFAHPYYWAAFVLIGHAS